MKICTYNINGINGWPSNFSLWLEEEKPDIVCLQELKATKDKFPLETITKLGYKSLRNGPKSWNCVSEMHIMRYRIEDRPFSIVT